MHNFSPLNWNPAYRLLPLLLLCLIIVGTGCSNKSSSTPPAKVTSVEIAAANTNLAVNTRLQLDVTAFYDNGEKELFGSEVIWSSSDSEIATVDNTGIVNAVATGPVTITAEYNGIRKEITLNIKSAEILSINISPPLLNVLKDQSTTLSAIGVFSDGSQQDITHDVTWTATDKNLISLTENNIKGNLVGTSTIIASLNGVSGSASVTVEAPSLISIEVESDQTNFLVGETPELIVNGLFSNGKIYDISDNVDWQVSDDAIASIEDKKIILKQDGNIDLTVSLNDISVTQTLNVIPIELVDIKILQIDSPIIAGESTQLQAIGIFTDGKNHDITDRVQWSTNAADIGTISNAIGYEGLLTTNSSGDLIVSATLEETTITLNVTISSAILTAIDITWQQLVLAKGTYAKLLATGIYSDNSFKDITTDVSWNVADNKVALIDNNNLASNFIYGLAPGTTQVSAHLNGISSQATVTITEARLVDIYIENSPQQLHKGAKHSLQAAGVFSDGTAQYVTDQVTWTSNNAQISVSNQNDNPGLLTVDAPGDAVITAILGDISASITVNAKDKVIQSIQIETLDTAISVGTSTNIIAIAIFSDNSSADVTNEVTFTTSDNSGLSVSNARESKGLLTGLAAGEYTISISSDINASVSPLTITVLDTILDRIEISPRNLTVPEGIVTQLTATGIFTDNSQQDLTQQVLWKSSNDVVAFISNAVEYAGDLHSIKAGETVITATFNDKTAQANVAVATNSLQNISLIAEDGDNTVPAGFSKTISAIGNYADGSNQNVTSLVSWQINDASICQFEGSINSSGVVIAKKAGTCQISAIFADQSASLIFTVSDALLTGLKITPENIKLPKGLNTKLQVFGIYSDGSERDITTDVTLQTSDSDLINLSNEASLVTAVNEGTARVEVYHAGQTAVTEIIVSAETLTAINITSPFSNYYKGRLAAFKAIGIFSDEPSKDISSQVLWEINNESIATIDNANDFGVLQATTGGELTVRATFAGVSGELTINIEDNPTIPVSISLNATPTAILNNGIETSEVTINVLAADSSQTVPDNTPVQITVANRNGNVHQQTVNTINGTANYSFSTLDKGINYIIAAIPDSLIISYIAIYATDDLSQMIGLLRFASASFTQDNLIQTGSAFGYYAINLSNREFNIDGFVVISADTILYSSANPDTPLGLDDMILSAGEELFFLYQTESDVENAVAAALYLTDQATGQQINAPQSFVLTPP